MSKQYPGGFIIKNPTTPTASSAPGMWTLNQAAYYTKQGIWPAPPTIDPYFRYVTTLLHGDGTNGAQNNTFLDSSTNNYTLTRSGNATQGTFTPYGANWSNYFDGTTDYLTAPANAAFGFGTGDFTAECWVYPVSWVGLYDGFISTLNSGTAVGIHLSRDGVEVNGVATAWGTTLSLNTWTHLALTRSGTSLRLFVNGALTNSGTNSANIGSSSAFAVGRRLEDFNNYYCNAYISNARIVKGTAVYTSAFTPSTTPLTAISGTSVLTCADNRFIDDSTNNFTITRNGDVSVQRFSPFAPAAAYSTSVNGGSMYLDGSGDQLTTPSQANFRIDQGNWTWEGWVYPTVLKNGNVLISLGTGGTNVWYIIAVGEASGTITLGTNNGTWNFIGIYTSSTGVIKANQWNHFAVVYSGTTAYFFANGVAAGSQASPYLAPGQSGTLYIGSYYNNYNNDGSWYAGYVTDLRFVQGTAVYSGSTYTAPTAPLTAITNTKLLLSSTNAGIFDNAMMRDWETLGNAQISTSVKKYGTGSMYFDGTGDYLSSPPSDLFAFGTGDFTIEFWAYKTANTPGNYDIAFGTGDAGTGNNGYFIELSSTRGFVFASNNSVVLSYAMNPNTSSWKFYTITRSSGTLRLFVDGSVVASTTYTTSLPCTVSVRVGGTGNNFFGYIDDLRVTKGYARYTTTFTPPTSALPDQ